MHFKVKLTREGKKGVVAKKKKKDFNQGVNLGELMLYQKRNRI